MSRFKECNLSTISSSFLKFFSFILLFTISNKQVLGFSTQSIWSNVEFIPQNNDANINPDTQLKITFPSTPIIGISGKIRVFDVSTNLLVDSIDLSIPPGPKNSRTPAPYDKMVYKNDLWDPANGYDRTYPPPVLPPLESPYQKKYIGGIKDSDVYHFYPVLIDNNTAIITLHKKLEYDKTYDVKIDEGVLSFIGDDSILINNNYEWRFTTKKNPPNIESSKYVVASDGSGDFNTVQGALEYIPENNLSRKTIFIKNGVYHEIVYVRDKDNVTILGSDRDSVVVTYPNNGFFNARPTVGNREEMISKFRNRRAIFALDNCNDTHLLNLSIISIGDAPAQNEGLLIKGERCIVYNVTIEGSGDALQANGTIYIENCSIKGYGDNVLGHGTVFFKNCDFISTFGPHLWVRNSKDNHGNILVGCTLRTVGEIETVIARAPFSNNYSFPFVEAVLIDCKLDGIKSEGWGRVGDDWSNIRYWEYNSTNLSDGSPAEVSQRASYSKQLTWENDSLTIANYSNPTYIFNGWTPSFQYIYDDQSNEKIRDEFCTFRWWDNKVSKMPYSWYKTDEGIRATENLLSWQDEGSGWPLMNTICIPFTGDISKAGPWGMKAALNSSTVNELRFLSKAYSVIENEIYKTAVLGGLNYILDAQLDSGGWPHSYPFKDTDYAHYATYNDNVISDIMTFLAEVMNSPDFKFIGEDNLYKVKMAYEKGLDFILNSQLEINGVLTAWAQQYDENTLQPKAARKFEPAAISGDESAGVLLFLMSIRKPSDKIINAIEAGAQWYKDSQINGVELIRSDGDQFISPSLSAPPIWARFYEIGTNRPIFAGRSGIIRYNLNEIEPERRSGYSWYNYKGTTVLNRYIDWLHERKWDNQPVTNIDESKVKDYTLPSLLVTKDGSMVQSTADWENKRRPEIIELFENHQHGRIPSESINTRFEVIEENVLGMNGKSLRTQVRIHVGDTQNSHIIRLLLNVPVDTKGSSPTLLHLSFTPNVLLFDETGIDEGMAWNTRLKIKVPDREANLLKDIDPYVFIDNGFAIATVYYGDIEPDFNEGRNYGVRATIQNKDNRDSTEWGAIGAWAWGLSRVMDYLQTNNSIDKQRIALSGVSRLGKTVLWTAAQDQRFAMVIPIVSGEGGAAISRRNFGETIADLTNPHRYHYWFAPRYADYAFSPDKLPVDGHMLLSLIAPRPVLQIVGVSDTWSDPKGEWIAAKEATPVYNLYGLEGLRIKEYPSPGTVILNDMGFYIHEAGHSVIPEDFEIMVKFMKKHFN